MWICRIEQQIQSLCGNCWKKERKKRRESERAERLVKQRKRGSGERRTEGVGIDQLSSMTLTQTLGKCRWRLAKQRSSRTSDLAPKPGILTTVSLSFLYSLSLSLSLPVLLLYLPIILLSFLRLYLHFLLYLNAHLAREYSWRLVRYLLYLYISRRKGDSKLKDLDH